MSWLKKLFGGGASLEQLRRQVDQKRYAEAWLTAEELAGAELDAAGNEELSGLRCVAGDGLARLNLDEARALQRSGDQAAAAEHLQLALAQVCSDPLRAEIEAAATTPLEPELVPATAGGDGVGSAPSSPTAEGGAQQAADAACQLELILTSYPAPLGDRYRSKSELFHQAFLLSHGGDDAAALPLWEQVADGERDELYWFEYGAALARAGAAKQARAALEQAVRLQPDFLLAYEALIPLLSAAGETAEAEGLLRELLKQGGAADFCHTQLCLLALRREQPQAALEHAGLALAAGAHDPGFLQLGARLYEQAGELDEAERLLRRLPGGGCGGGLSLPLAEFWLRQERELGRVLDTFNAACRQEPDNPRWQLRAAQTYLARQWKKEGLALLRKVAEDPRLEADLQQEAQQQLQQVG